MQKSKGQPESCRINPEKVLLLYRAPIQNVFEFRCIVLSSTLYSVVYRLSLSSQPHSDPSRVNPSGQGRKLIHISLLEIPVSLQGPSGNSTRKRDILSSVVLTIFNICWIIPIGVSL